jgi:hypothetical protein
MLQPSAPIGARLARFHRDSIVILIGAVKEASGDLIPAAANHLKPTRQIWILSGPAP